MPLEIYVYEINQSQLRSSKHSNETVTMPATRSQSQADKVRLKANLMKFLRIEEPTSSNNSIVKALEYAGVTEWNNEFMVLGETYIDQLMVPGARATDP